MPNSYRIVTRIQDQDDFAGSLTNDYYLKYSSGTGKFSLQPLSVSPGGSSGQVQYNNAGSFGGAALVIYATSGTLLTVTAGATTDVPFAVNGAASHTGDLQQWKVNGTTKTVVSSSGAVVLHAGAYNAPSLYFSGATIGWYSNSGTWAYTTTGGLVKHELTATAYKLEPNSVFGWTNTTNNATASLDTALARSSAGVVTVTNGSTGSGSLLVNAASSSTVPVTIRGAASQSANLTEWQNSSTTVVAKVSSAGDITTYSKICFEDANGYISRTSSTNSMSFSASIAAVQMVLTGAGLYAPNRIYSLNAHSTIDMTVGPQNRGGNTGTGGSITILGGTGSTSGTPTAGGASYLKGGDGGTNQNGGAAYVLGGARNGSGIDGDVAIGYTGSAAIGNLSLFGAGSFGSGVNVVFIANATTIPSTDPTGGGILYCEGGALKFRGSSGTVTTVAPA